MNSLSKYFAPIVAAAVVLLHDPQPALAQILKKPSLARDSVAVLLPGKATAVVPSTRAFDRTSLGYETMVVVKSGKATAVPASASTIQLFPGTMIAGRFDSSAVRKWAGDTLVFEIPYDLRVLDAAGKEVNMRPVVEVEGGGFRLRPRNNGYQGSLRIGLEDQMNPGSADSIGQEVNILVTATADSVNPADLMLDHVNLPYKSLTIVALDPGDSVQVRIRPSFDPRGVRLAIPVIRPSLNVSFSPERIQGYGLETANVTVQMSGMPDPTGMTVSLTSDRSKLEPAMITLNAAGFGHSTIRSIGLGPATVTATSRVSKPVVASLRFERPITFLLFAFLGGILGGLGRFFRDWKDPTLSAGWKLLVVNVASGLTFGLIMTILYANGIDLIPVKPSATVGGTLVGAVSIIGGFFGPSLLSGLSGLVKQEGAANGGG